MHRMTNLKTGLLITGIVLIMLLIRTTRDGELILQILFSSESNNGQIPAFSMIQYSDIWFMILLPLMISVPFLFPLEDALQGGYWRTQVSRTGKRGFICRALSANLFSGSCFLLLGYLLYVVLCYFRLPLFSDITDLSTGQPFQYRNDLLHTESESYGVFVRICIFAAVCMLTASACMLSMQLSRNKFRGIGSVMILCYLLDTLSGVLALHSVPINTRWYIISPTEHLMNAETMFTVFGVSFWWYWGGMAALILLLNLCSAALLKRRINW